MFAYMTIWIATAAAVSFGIYFTGDANCLWAMLIPALVSFNTNKGSVNGAASEMAGDGDE